MEKIDYLDSLKGIAILGVFLVHSTMFLSLLHITNLPFSIEQLLYLGRYGVSVFFIISGYTIFRSLMNKRVEKDFFIKYATRKIFRLAPPFYVTLLIAFILSLTTMQNDLNITYSNMLMHFTFLYGLNKNTCNNVLGVEWFLFNTLIFSFLVLIPYKFRKYLTCKNTFTLFIITLLISLLFNVEMHFLNVRGIIDTTTYTWLYFSPINWLFTFSSGIFMFYFFQDINTPKIKLISTYSKALLIFITVSFVVIAYLNLPIESIIVSLLIIVLIFTLQSIWFTNKKFSYLFKLFDNKPFRNLGKISYSFYLVHYLLLTYLKRFIHTGLFTNVDWVNYLLLVLISFVLSLIIAFVLYYFVERKSSLLENLLCKKLNVQ